MGGTSRTTSASSRTTARRALVGLAGLVAVLTVAGTVGAGGAWASGPDGSGDGQSCVVAAGSSVRACFDTPDEAFAFATDGAVDPVVADSASAVDHATLDAQVNSYNAGVARRASARSAAPAAVASSIDDGPVLGALWKDKNYQGAVVILTGTSGSGCYGATYGFPSARAFGMNDAITSVATYSGCAVTLYKDDSYKGTSLTIQVESAYVGSTMNDQTSSVVFRPRS